MALELNSSQKQELVADIKQKKELRGISAAFVLKELEKVLRKETKLQKELLLRWNSRSSAYKMVVKKVREQLRRVYGLFRVIEQGKTLETHLSTKERWSFYSELYRQLFAITGKPKIILDLGCGLNPLSLPFMKLKEVRYYAYDLSEEEIQIINSFFQKKHENHKKVVGKAILADITDIPKMKELPAADVAFLFKVTDVLDRNKGHTVTEEVLKAVPAQYVVVSFSTKTMSGKLMTAPRRKWMEWLCWRLGWKYAVLEFKNEIFYVARKT